MTEVFLQRIILQKNFPKKCWPGFRYYYFHGSRDPFILLITFGSNQQRALSQFSGGAFFRRNISILFP